MVIEIVSFPINSIVIFQFAMLNYQRVRPSAGNMVAVNGPHGSGKATLLRLLGHVA